MTLPKERHQYLHNVFRRIKEFVVFTAVMLLFLCLGIAMHGPSDFQQLPGPMKSHGSLWNFPRNSTLGRLSSKKAVSFISDEKEQDQRRQIVHEYCQANGYKRLKADDTLELMYSRKYNLTAYSIPKIGSTFLLHMFSILNNGTINSEQEFQRSRSKVHRNSHATSKFTKKQLNKILTIAIVRNPYSRLFAAYVDKIFLPNNQKLIINVISHSRQSNSLFNPRSFLSNILGQFKFSNTAFKQHTVSFQDFLSYALNSEIFHTLEDHYDPCFPRLRRLICNTNNYAVVKQESFADDIKHILQKVHLNLLDPQTYDVINKSLEESRAEVAIPGIIKTVLSKFSKENKIWNRQVLIERIWHSFQIQGYIDKNSLFPAKDFTSDSDLKESKVIQTILEEIEKHPLTPAQTHKQRREAIVEAYRQVDAELIEKIHEVYADDFAAFQYDKEI